MQPCHLTIQMAGKISHIVQVGWNSCAAQKSSVGTLVSVRIGGPHEGEVVTLVSELEADPVEQDRASITELCNI
jgi:hypothetical protein